ncbi:MAG: hypothetical protein RLZZ618_1444 [Pseudomonadota bacterium]
MLWNEAASTGSPPSKPSFERWVSAAVASGRLRKVRNGLFLNASGNKAVSVGAAAGYIRQSAVPSLAWVLEQDWVLNNWGGVVTCVVSMTPGLTVPNLSRVKTAMGEFRFKAMPWHVYELDQVPVEDWRDTRFAHPRATPEKAFCDWLYFAASPRSPTQRPPLDLELDRLNFDRLHRLALAMSISSHLNAWVAAKRQYDNDPEVMENASMKTKASRP